MLEICKTKLLKMKTYKITSKQKIEALANRKNKLLLISIIIIIGILIVGIVIISIKEKHTNNIASISIVTFIALLFWVMYKNVKKMIYLLVKHKYVCVDNNSIIIGYSNELKSEFNFLQRYFYHRGNRYNAYSDRVLNGENVKSVTKTAKGLRIKVSKGILKDILFIPKEMDNLREIEQEIKKMIRH